MQKSCGTNAHRFVLEHGRFEGNVKPHAHASTLTRERENVSSRTCRLGPPPDKRLARRSHVTKLSQPALSGRFIYFILSTTNGRPTKSDRVSRAWNIVYSAARGSVICICAHSEMTGGCATIRNSSPCRRRSAFDTPPRGRTDIPSAQAPADRVGSPKDKS